jgi:hypothetical protein
MSYNELLLKYFTGKLNTSSGSDVPIFRTPTYRQNYTKNFLDEKFPYGYEFDPHVIQGKDRYGNGTSYIVVHGTYASTSGGILNKGFICIFNQNFTLEQIITEFSSGTKLNRILRLEVGDDGYFYGIDSNNGTLRFVMLNNITIKAPTDTEFKVILRQSYNLSGLSASLARCSNIIKAPNMSKYLIVGFISINDKLLATELTINVGSSNNWVDYTYNTENAYPMSAIANWNGEGVLTFQIATFTSFNNWVNANFVTYRGNSSQGTTMTMHDYGVYTDSDGFSGVILGFDDLYFSAVEHNTTLKLYRCLNGTITQLKAISNVVFSLPTMKMMNIGDEVFYMYSKTVNNYKKNYIGRIVGNNCYEQEIVDVENPTLFIVQKQFNLYNYFVQFSGNVSGNYMAECQQVYNSNNYNGLEYVATNSLTPKHSILYDDNNLMFARNLYNKVVNGNTTTSTLNIPNNFVNDVNIGNIKLYGETNIELENDERPLITNIYEELMINFIETMYISNRNDPNNIIFNQSGANRLNSSATDLNDYNNAKMSKYRLNYSDDTTEIKSLDNSNPVVSTEDGYKTTFNIVFLNPINKNVESIDLISNDENTVYQTIELNNLTSGKLYRLAQDVNVVYR